MGRLRCSLWFASVPKTRPWTRMLLHYNSSSQSQVDGLYTAVIYFFYYLFSLFFYILMEYCFIISTFGHIFWTSLNLSSPSQKMQESQLCSFVGIRMTSIVAEWTDGQNGVIMDGYRTLFLYFTVYKKYYSTELYCSIPNLNFLMPHTFLCWLYTTVYLFPFTLLWWERIAFLFHLSPTSRISAVYWISHSISADCYFTRVWTSRIVKFHCFIPSSASSVLLCGCIDLYLCCIKYTAKERLQFPQPVFRLYSWSSKASC